MKNLRYSLSGLLLLFVGSMQAQDGFGDPPEPQVPVFYYPLTMTCDPDVAGTVAGKGSYAPGTTSTLSTSAKSGYTFSHWTLNGETISQPASFSYTTVAGPMVFVAHYNLDPIDPAEPTMNVKSRLYLTSEPEGICTFNRTSGAFVQADEVCGSGRDERRPVVRVHRLVQWQRIGERRAELQLPGRLSRRDPHGTFPRAALHSRRSR